ncbi:MAG: enoyl-CoA hydratase/isomerase [Methylovulum sp.]|nr:enoyl-CoA hydratase/isomerase [Methylovulum sp.]
MMDYQTIQLRYEPPVCFLKLFSPQTNNTITLLMIDECLHALAACAASMQIIVLEGLPECFCLGADFQGLHNQSTEEQDQTPERFYDLLIQLANGAFVSIAHVRGKVNAGGLGLVAACDIVLADESATFGLSELLFDLFPACVLPFLIRRIGFQKAHYMALMTKAIPIQQALDWGLVDAYEAHSEALLRKHLLRLRYLSKAGILNYKRYMAALDNSLWQARPLAIAANRELFSDAGNLEKINRYVQTGQFPWES